MKTSLQKKPWQVQQPKIILIGSCLILMLTTIFWSWHSATIHRVNADQLANAYLAENSRTLHDAQLPSQHTFLLKLPIWLILRHYNFSANSFITLTILVSLVTVGAFAYLLYRLTRRDKYLTSILILVLSSVLLLMPAQPYPGGLLPGNLAMLTTRNLEYIVYLLALILTVGGRRRRTYYLIAALLTILFISDRYFVTLAIGGGLLCLLAGIIFKHRSLRLVAGHWLILSVAAYCVAVSSLLIMSSSGLMIAGGGQSAGPYMLSLAPGNIIKGTLYAALTSLTNFGANPVDNQLVLRTIPGQLWRSVGSLTAASYIFNGLSLVAIGLSIKQLLKRQFHSRHKHVINHTDHRQLLGLMLLGSSIAALAAYILTNHYFPVDGRYLMIMLFSGFCILATELTFWHFDHTKLRTLGAVSLIIIGLGVFAAQRWYNLDQKAVSDVDHRNQIVAEVLKSHDSHILVGDYWRVMPIRLVDHNSQIYTPLQDCITPRQVLSSRQWQPDLRHQAFAYLLTIDKSLTDFPTCSVEQVIQAYGKPNSFQLISGTNDRPKEMLLFYDHGINSPTSTITQQQANTVIEPRQLSAVKPLTCPVGTIMNIVAHEDDDILFLNPDTSRAIAANKCVSTIYLTAGDGGNGQFYWHNRLDGARAAYSHMLGDDNLAWKERIIKLADKQYVTIASPSSTTASVALIFFALPDGNIKGQGFASSNYENLERLYSGLITKLHSLDGQSEYTQTELVDALSQLIGHYQPNEIHTQLTHSEGSIPDHIDHQTVGLYANLAYQNYYTNVAPTTPPAPLYYYYGYGIKNFPENLSAEDIIAKSSIFYTYGQHDGAVCHDDASCRHNPAYYYYLRRQYRTE